jgi:hypothetical protein
VESRILNLPPPIAFFRKEIDEPKVTWPKMDTDPLIRPPPPTDIADDSLATPLNERVDPSDMESNKDTLFENLAPDRTEMLEPKFVALKKLTLLPKFAVDLTLNDDPKAKYPKEEILPPRYV